MSEQTPDSTGDFDSDLMMGSSEENEPSMEDILASIRKIISEDGDPVPLERPDEGVMAASNEVSPGLTDNVETSAPIAFPQREDEPDPAATSISPSTDPVTASGADDDFDIDALLNDIALSEPDAPPLSIPDIEMDDEPVALEIPMMPDDDDPPSEPASAAGDDETDDDFFERVLAVGDEGDKRQGSEPDDQDDPLIDLLLSQDLTEPVAPASTASTPEPSGDDLETDLVSYQAAELVAERVLSSRPAQSIDTGDDLDLVKSLMADLTDIGEETSDTGAYSDGDDEDIMNDIFDMALDDEISRGPSLDDPLQDEAHPDERDETVTADLDALASELIEASGVESVGDEPVAMSHDSPAHTPPAPSRQSLADIAAAAEADATAAETRLSTLSENAASIAAGSAVAATAASLSQDDAMDLDAMDDFDVDEILDAVVTEDQSARPSVELESGDAPETETMGFAPEKETTMPSAVRKDMILDDMTEEATMSAFAELNTLVEERTVLEERGPRIGDLVQEALKPMLKEWLDDNLQGIVERAVAKEVKRIANGK